MDILVSFCNVSMPQRARLALVDSATLECRVARIPSGQRGPLSVAGVAVSANFLFAALPGNSSDLSKLLILDRTDLRLIRCYDFFSVVDVHSLWWSDPTLYVVSTGTDELVELRLRGPDVLSESVFWRPDRDGPREDRHHLNAVHGWRGDLLVSGFGRKTGETWSLTRDGFVFNITRGERVASGVPHPHSLAVVDGAIAFCESARMAVRVLGKGNAAQLPGYARGMCVAGRHLFVGTSVGRRVSKSTGLINSPNATGIPAGQCAICRLSLDGFTIDATIDMTRYGDEIYELLPIDGTDSWPTLSGVRFVSLQETRKHLIEMAACDIVRLIPAGQPFILADEDVFRREVAGGHRAIPFLERDGQYWGRPADDAAAVGELERLRRAGAGFIVFGWPAFWWLDYYSGLEHYLRTAFRCVLENERLVAFDLRRPASDRA